jgi:hypothetical protein
VSEEFCLLQTPLDGIVYVYGIVGKMAVIGHLESKTGTNM